ncbi:DUF4247 domain-containing protein [Ornithinibacillus halophilus]|uniref:DUF4247 domain-containing protein n=1 Tax=Ornithinibacillus halophilus TaxID=930117 RepID=A0A1M5GQD1_9BACI|nr:DUF4247 domain-containing protein [Ornithinibacillus halophilus]SHG05944.1 protein of unknown function [Ornithinibacillus halophilus]
MRNRISIIGLFSLLILLSACSSGGESITAEDIPTEPSKDAITNAIKQAGNYEMDDIIEANFPEVLKIEGDSSNAEVYGTTRFGLTELSSLLSDTVQPEEISDVKDNQQILIYPDDFITLRESEADPNVLLIEVASDEFVRRNYSPNFLSTYFAFRILDDMLDTRDWSKRQGGSYSGMGSLNKPSRGFGSFRGGGPGTGK